MSLGEIHHDGRCLVKHITFRCDYRRNKPAGLMARYAGTLVFALHNVDLAKFIRDRAFVENHLDQKFV